MPISGTNHDAIEPLGAMPGVGVACVSPATFFYFSSFTTVHKGAVRNDAS